MPHEVTAQLIRLQSEQLQDLDLSPERCRELAREVSHYNRVVRDAAAALAFDADPADFAKALVAFKEHAGHD